MLSSLWYLIKYFGIEKYKILDFGGGGGTHFFSQQKNLQSSLESWIVLETETMVKACKDLEDSCLKFHTRDQLIHQDLKFDVVFSSCALQYTDSPIESLNYLLSLQAKIMCFSRIALTNADEEIEVIEISKLNGNGPRLSGREKNSKNVSYRSIAIPEEKFEEIIKQNYTIKLKIDNGIPQAYQKAGIRNVKLKTYIAVINPNHAWNP